MRIRQLKAQRGVRVHDHHRYTQHSQCAKQWGYAAVQPPRDARLVCRMEWSKPESGEDNALKIPRKWLYLHYYEALTALFRIENALRMFVYVVLKDERKSKWGDLTISSDDGNDTTIVAIAKKRLTQDERFGYLGYRISSPLMHLTSGELIRVILADSYWPWFAQFFPMTKEIVRTKLEEIGNIRNALAHFRPIKSDDVEVVKQNANQVLSRVEDALQNVVNTNQAVPTNTTDAWYSELKAIAGQYCSTSFRQSENENWIQLIVPYSCPIVGAPYVGESYARYEVLTLNSSNILRKAPTILDHVIFASELVPYAFLRDQQTPEFRKSVQLLFSRHTLAAQYAALKRELEDVVRTITTESDLILEDNLARGELVRLSAVTANKHEKYGFMPDNRQLATPLRPDDPVEYWGGKPAWTFDLVTDTDSYPWMPVNVSEPSLVF